MVSTSDHDHDDDDNENNDTTTAIPTHLDTVRNRTNRWRLGHLYGDTGFAAGRPLLFSHAVLLVATVPRRG